MKISTVSQMRDMDQTAIAKYNIPDGILMENAGLAAYRVLSSVVDLAQQETVVFCGSGNNGGDGLVVARLIYSAGGNVQIVLLSDSSKFAAASAVNYKAAEALGIPIVSVGDISDLDDFLENVDVVVDAILGTGLQREVTGDYADVIDAINRSYAVVMSIDIPSGVQGDTGQALGVAIQADCTVTFGLPKLGNLLLPGWDLGGALAVSHISFPPGLYNGDHLQAAVNTPLPLPKRVIDGHKGTFGQALFVAGAADYYGAPSLASMSFLKAGGGYSRLATPRSAVPTLAAMAPEVVFVPQAETDSGSLAENSCSDIVDLANKLDITIVGPGLSREPETMRLVLEVVPEIETPLLIDGDGISAVCEDRDVVRKRKAPTVLTPHLGEMSRLTGKSIADLKSDHVVALRELCTDLNAVVVMKGAHTLIGYPDGRVYINLTGNPGMGTAGSGDVLTGTIAALYGQGMSFGDAVRMGVFVHGLAGDLAAEVHGEDGMTATDILGELPAAVKALRENYHDVVERYEIPVVS